MMSSTASRPLVLFGSRGQVGWELERTLAPLGPVAAPTRAELDLTDDGAVRSYIAQVQPSIVVNAAAYTAVDRAEEEPDVARAVNARVPTLLAECAAAAGALMVHFSTDYVFDGTKVGSYSETDVPNPVSVYGRTKLAGERGVQAAGGAHLILRTTWVYSLRRSNFFLTMLRLAERGVPLRVIHTQHGAPTPARLIAEVTAHLLMRWRLTPPDDRPSGVYHLAAAGATSWHGFAEAIFREVYGEAAPAVTPITPAEYPTPAARPSNSVFDCTALVQTFGVVVPHWEDALRQVVDAWRAGKSLPGAAGPGST